MNWAFESHAKCAPLECPAPYRTRTADESDEDAFLSLMQDCGWEFTRERTDYCYARLLPGGWWVVTDELGAIVASAMGLHNYSGRSPLSATLGWVACSAEHRGNKLGSVVVSAVVDRLLQIGYREIELYTEAFRLPAIKSYFRLGFVPYIYDQRVQMTWQRVCEEINEPFAPDSWPSGNNAFPAF